jgi:pyridoxine 5-phosphate synthase
MPKLGVNVDHVATLRQARRAAYPDPVEASLAAQRAGAEAITVHLREDRRHICDDDLRRIRKAIKIRLNQEMAPVTEMVDIALELQPHEVCLVPERREELTTEGGLDVAGLREKLTPIVDRLKQAGIGVSLFIDPEPSQIEAAASIGANFVELHTGSYAQFADADLAQHAARPRANSRVDVASLSADTRAELEKLRVAVKLARSRGLKANIGHGMNYRNVGPVTMIPGIAWFHIGHSIVSRAVMVGMGRAVSEMNELINRRDVASIRRR